LCLDLQEVTEGTLRLYFMCYSVFGIVTTLRAGWSGVRIPVGERGSVLQNAMGLRLFPGDEVDHSPPSSAEVKNSGTTPLSPLCVLMLWTGKTLWETVHVDVRKSVHHHTIQITQPTRNNSFTSLLLDLYLLIAMCYHIQYKIIPSNTSNYYLIRCVRRNNLILLLLDV
jgi:hypothetical protein